MIGALRKEYPDIPIHVHTHDTAGTGVASMIAAAHAGADAVDASMDAMSGTTSQPSIGALVGALHNTPYDTGLDRKQINAVNGKSWCMHVEWKWYDSYLPTLSSLYT